ncbi:MAG: urea ABC transporter permease subunit UrtC [Fibrobacteres bacterium]|nr:urea ABC transporter permease subunit UrtC [Fibrobacterota bacterium]
MKTSESFFRRERTALVLSALAVIAVPSLNALGIVSDNNLNLLGRYFCFALAALGIDLIWGYTGILSLCQALFFCLGGYCIGMHMLLKTGTQSVYGSALPDFMVWNQVKSLPLFWEPFRHFPVALALALAVPVLFALLFGFFAFRSRIKGVYLSIITQALALAMWLIFLRNETMLGGTNGLTDFKTLLGLELARPGVKRGLYMLTAAALIVSYFAARYLVSSKAGKVLVAIRDSEHRLRFTGFPVTRYKLFAFCMAALLAAIGGILYVPQTGIITPGRMDVKSSLEMIVWVAVGGRGTLGGPILGAIGTSLAYTWLTSKFPGTWLYFLGFLFITVVLFFPQGAMGALAKLRFPRAARKPSAVANGKSVAHAPEAESETAIAAAAQEGR